MMFSCYFSNCSDSLRRTRLILLVLLLVGLYGISKTPFLSGKGSFSHLKLLFNYLSTLENSTWTLKNISCCIAQKKSVADVKACIDWRQV